MSLQETLMWSNPRIAELYKVAERATGPFARSLIRQAGVYQVTQTPLVVLDNACGTGVVSAQLYETLEESAKEKMQLTCADFSEHMVKAVTQRIEENHWNGATARLVDAQKTDFPSNHFTHVITSFGIMVMPDPTAALNECHRILQPGGTIALSTWTTVGWMPIVRTAFAKLPPSLPRFPDTETFISSWGSDPSSDPNNIVPRIKWHDPTSVSNALTTHGFGDVHVTVERKTSKVMNAKEFSDTFESMVQFVIGKFWSEEQRREGGGLVMNKVREVVVEKYGVDGELEMEWGAVLAVGRKPKGGD